MEEKINNEDLERWLKKSRSKVRELKKKLKSEEDLACWQDLRVEISVEEWVISTLVEKLPEPSENEKKA